MASKRPKQTMIEGTEPPSVPEIDEAAEKYRELRDVRLEALQMEIDAQNELLAAMHKHKLQSYEYDGYMVLVAPKEKVSVRRKPGGNNDADEE